MNLRGQRGKYLESVLFLFPVEFSPLVVILKQSERSSEPINYLETNYHPTKNFPRRIQQEKVAWKFHPRVWERSSFALLKFNINHQSVKGVNSNGISNAKRFFLLSAILNFILKWNFNILPLKLFSFPFHVSNHNFFLRFRLLMPSFDWFYYVLFKNYDERTLK